MWATVAQHKRRLLNAMQKTRVSRSSPLLFKFADDAAADLEIELLAVIQA